MFNSMVPPDKQIWGALEPQGDLGSKYQLQKVLRIYFNEDLFYAQNPKSNIFRSLTFGGALGPQDDLRSKHCITQKAPGI